MRLALTHQEDGPPSPLRRHRSPAGVSERRRLREDGLVLLAWGAAGLTEAAGIAWEAHLGGFYAGLLLYGFFDRPPPPEDDAAGAE